MGSHLVTVLHELRQVQQRLCDLGDVLRGESQLDAADELVLLVLAQLGPTRQKRRVEQVSVEPRKPGETRVGCHSSALRNSAS